MSAPPRSDPDLPPDTPLRRASRAIDDYLYDTLDEDEIAAIERSWGFDRASFTWRDPAAPELGKHLSAMEVAGIEGYIGCDRPLQSGRTAAEEVLAGAGKPLGPAERAYAAALARSFVDLYEVRAVGDGAVELESVLRTARATVREPEPDRFGPTGLVLARVLDLGDRLEAAEVGHVPRADKQRLVEWFDRTIASPDRTTLESLKRDGSRLIVEWARLARSRRRG